MHLYKTNDSLPCLPQIRPPEEPSPNPREPASQRQTAKKNPADLPAWRQQWSAEVGAQPAAQLDQCSEGAIAADRDHLHHELGAE